MLRPPDYSALINRFTCSAFTLRYESRHDFVTPVEVDATGSYTSDILLDWVVECQVCDAVMAIAPFVMITTPLVPEYAGRLFLARVDLEINGRRVVSSEPLGRFVVTPPYCVAGAKEVTVGRPEEELLGTCKLEFVANKDLLRVGIRGIPLGAKFHLNVGVLGALYTIKAPTGEGFGVGLLDEHQHASPVGFTWDPEVKRGDLESNVSRALREYAERRCREEEAVAAANRRAAETQAQLGDAIARLKKAQDRAADEKGRGGSAQFKLEEKGSGRSALDESDAFTRARWRMLKYGVAALFTFASVGASVLYILSRIG